MRLLLSLGKQRAQRGMRAQKGRLRGPFARAPTPVAHAAAPSRWRGGSPRSARRPPGSGPPRALLGPLHPAAGSLRLVGVAGPVPSGPPGPPLLLVGLPAGPQVLRWADRKSTRLNSSHDQISYAVLCLTKKIQTMGL